MSLDHPCRPCVAPFFTLTALAEAPCHGYGIIGRVVELSNGVVRLRPGTLYGALDRQVDQELDVLDREEVEAGRLRRAAPWASPRECSPASPSSRGRWSSPARATPTAAPTSPPDPTTASDRQPSQHHDHKPARTLTRCQRGSTSRSAARAPCLPVRDYGPAGKVRTGSPVLTLVATGWSLQPS